MLRGALVKQSIGTDTTVLKLLAQLYLKVQ